MLWRRAYRASENNTGRGGGTEGKGGVTGAALVLCAHCSLLSSSGSVESDMVSSPVKNSC